MPDPWKNNGWGEGTTRPDQKAKAKSKGADIGSITKQAQEESKETAENVGGIIGEVGPNKFWQGTQQYKDLKNRAFGDQ